MKKVNDIIFKINRIKKWHYIHRRFRTPFYQFLLYEGTSKHYNKKIKFPYEMKNLLYNNKELFADDYYWQIMRRKTYKKILSDKRFFKRIIDNSYSLNNKIEKFAKELKKIDYEKISTTNLTAMFSSYVDLTLKYSYCVLIPLFLEEDLEKNLKELINRKCETDREKIFQTLSAPVKPGVTFDAEINILQMAIKVKNGLNISGDVKKYLEDFAWIKNNAFDSKFCTVKEIEKMAVKAANKQPEEKLRNALKKSQKLRNELKKYRSVFMKNKRALALIDTVREAVYFRSWRTERYYRNAYFLQPLFEKISELIGAAKSSDLFYLTPFEILDLLAVSKKADLKAIKQRKKAYLIFADGEKTIIMSDEVAIMAEEEFAKKSLEEMNIIKGQTAYPGVVKGSVKVVLRKQELNQIKNGEILVTTSTTPNYVPYLKKVKAIITEEGGILCHASVISRELHIPCVIGTKIATKVLRDGDLVEVDADRGVVKIIKRAA